MDHAVRLSLNNKNKIYRRNEKSFWFLSFFPNYIVHLFLIMIGNIHIYFQVNALIRNKKDRESN